MSCSTKTVLMNINIDSDIHLEMLDGSKWFVNPGDLPTVATWIPTAEISIIKMNNDSAFSYKITNLGIGVTISAMKI